SHTNYAGANRNFPRLRRTLNLEIWGRDMKSNIAWRRHLLTGAALIALGAPAYAQSIDTTTSWNGTSFISSRGIPNTATYGQTIPATNSQNHLTSFTFNLAQQSGTPPNYQAFVYQWDSATNRIVGPALFTSGPLVAPTTATANTYVPVTIN